MKQVGLVCLTAMGVARVAAAQPAPKPTPPAPAQSSSGQPAEGPPPTATFLEKRVPDELASEGLLLSRRDLSLQIEQIGTRWLVSLIDLRTERVIASTKVDALPADREAAVATMTHVVAELTEQIVGRTERPAAPPAAAPPAPPAHAPAARPPVAPVVPLQDPAAIAARQATELMFRRQAIWFGPDYPTIADDTTGDQRSWQVFQGEPDQRLDPDAFYLAVGREDLLNAYHQRRIGGRVQLIIGGAALIGALGLFVYTSSDNCNANSPVFDSCESDRDRSDSAKNVVAAFLAAAGLLEAGLGTYYLVEPHPITEDEARNLADAYNRKLRGRLGLPIARREPLLRDLELAPRISSTSSGLTLTARF